MGQFGIKIGIDNVLADVSAGVEVLSAGGASLNLFYNGRFGDTIEENAGGARASLAF